MSTNQTIKSHATTREYVENYQQTDMAKVELGRYCQGCGRLPAWCECPYEARIHFAGQMAMPVRLGDKLLYPDGTEEMKPCR